MSHRDILAIDPSINSAGFAVFEDAMLVSACTIQCNAKGTIAERSLAMARKIIQAAPIYRITAVAVEWPRIYRGGRGDPNDLPGLAGVAMAVTALAGVPVLSYEPREWGGQLPKAKTKKAADTSPKALRIRSRLSEAELRVWPVGEHDAIDAIGIGLHALGRLTTKRVFDRS